MDHQGGTSRKLLKAQCGCQDLGFEAAERLETLVLVGLIFKLRSCLSSFPVVRI